MKETPEMFVHFSKVKNAMKDLTGKRNFTQTSITAYFNKL